VPKTDDSVCHVNASRPNHGSTVIVLGAFLTPYLISLFKSLSLHAYHDHDALPLLGQAPVSSLANFTIKYASCCATEVNLCIPVDDTVHVFACPGPRADSRCAHIRNIVTTSDRTSSRWSKQPAQAPSAINMTCIPPLTARQLHHPHVHHGNAHGPVKSRSNSIYGIQPTPFPSSCVSWLHRDTRNRLRSLQIMPYSATLLGSQCPVHRIPESFLQDEYKSHPQGYRGDRRARSAPTNYHLASYSKPQILGKQLT
jgi:hypothetical protein